MNITLALFLLIFLSGCTTTANISPKPTPIPCALSKEETRQAIMATLNDSPKKKLTQGQERTDKLLGFFLGEGYSRSQYWFYEGSGRDIVYTGYHNGNHYMRVEVRYSETDITYEIVDSKNLKQSHDSIHKNVFVWLGNFDRIIRANLGKYERYKIETKNLTSSPCLY